MTSHYLKQWWLDSWYESLGPNELKHLICFFQNLTDKNKSYRQRLEKDEETKRQQLRIMRRTHEVHLQEKQLLIKNLEDIIAEQENGGSS